MYGICYNKIGSFSCSCLPGFTGQNCEINIDECIGVICPENKPICEDRIDSYVCKAQIVLDKSNGDDETARIVNSVINILVIGTSLVVVYVGVKLGFKMSSVKKKKGNIKNKARTKMINQVKNSKNKKNNKKK